MLPRIQLKCNWKHNQTAFNGGKPNPFACFFKSHPTKLNTSFEIAHLVACGMQSIEMVMSSEKNILFYFYFD